MIRQAGPEDVEMIVGIFEESFATLDFLPKLHTHAENLAFFTRCIREGEAYLLGEGFALIAGDILSHLYVRPGANGRGIGTTLLDHVKTRRPAGFRFWVFQQNEKARRFYENRGCAVLELTDGSGNEEQTPDALYQWLPAGQGSSGR